MKQWLIPVEGHVAPIIGDGLALRVLNENDFTQDVPEDECPLMMKARQGNGREIAAYPVEGAKIFTTIGEVDVTMLPGRSKTEQFLCPATKYIAWQALLSKISENGGKNALRIEACAAT